MKSKKYSLPSFRGSNKTWQSDDALAMSTDNVYYVPQIPAAIEEEELDHEYLTAALLPQTPPEIKLKVNASSEFEKVMCEYYNDIKLS